MFASAARRLVPRGRRVFGSVRGLCDRGRSLLALSGEEHGGEGEPDPPGQEGEDVEGEELACAGDDPEPCVPAGEDAGAEEAG